MKAVLLVLALAGPALAQDPAGATPLGADAFGLLVEGRTLTYGAEDADAPRGVETYETGRRVTWLEIASGECLEGRWYGAGSPEAPQICFSYGGQAEKQCFRYYLDGRQVISTNLDGSLPEVSFLDIDTDGIACEFLGA